MGLRSGFSYLDAYMHSLSVCPRGLCAVKSWSGVRLRLYDFLETCILAASWVPST